MKRILNLTAAMLAVLTLVLGSCSRSGDGTIAALASTGDMAVAAFSPKQIFENAGCTFSGDSLVLSTAITNLPDGARIKELRGIDYDKAYFVMTAAKNNILYFTLKDADAFGQSIEKIYGLNSREIDGYTAYVISDGEAWLIRDNAGYFISGNYDSEPIDVLKAQLDAAQSAPLPSWQLQQLADGRAFTMLMHLGAYLDYNFSPGEADENIAVLGIDPEQYKTASTAIYGDLKGQKLSLEITLLDAEGKQLHTNFKVNDINSAIGDFAPADAMATVLFTLPQDQKWQDIIDAYINCLGGYRSIGIHKMYVQFAAQVLNDIDGTTMLSVSSDVVDFMQSKGHAPVPAIVIACEMKPGKAQDYLEQLKSLSLLTHLSVQPIDGGFFSDIPGLGFYLPITVRAIGNTLVIATGTYQAADKLPMPKSLYSGASSCCYITLSKDLLNSQAPNIDCGLSFEQRTSNDATTLSLQATDTDLPLLEAILSSVK